MNGTNKRGQKQTVSKQTRKRESTKNELKSKEINDDMMKELSKLTNQNNNNKNILSQRQTMSVDEQTSKA